jgi:N-carbamoylputrescine amidase
MPSVTVAAIQLSCTSDPEANVARAEALVREAAHVGAQIVLVPELFEHLYFCKDQEAGYFELAQPADSHATIERFAKLAAELETVLPLSFYERAGKVTFNSLAMIDADGSVLGVYRKSHIPDGPGYQEKYYFNPGDTGFRVWPTRYGTIGVAICWDQWFPEAARVMALLGAELLFYPTAIGSEPGEPDYDSSGHWQRVMQGHAGANMIPVVAANRYGPEQGDSCTVTFYGSSFITDHTGAKVAEAGRASDAVLTATFDLDAVRVARYGWGLFRDRRPDLYKPILTHDGHVTGGGPTM